MLKQKLFYTLICVCTLGCLPMTAVASTMKVEAGIEFDERVPVAGKHELPAKILPQTGEKQGLWEIVGGVLFAGTLIGYVRYQQKGKKRHKGKYKSIYVSVFLLGLSWPLFVQGAETQEIQGKATATFQPNPAVIYPVDPDEEGDIPIVPTHPPTEGPLSINYASDIMFAKQTIPKETATFYAGNETITQIAGGIQRETPNFVQITDNRGSAGGWKLNVRQNGAFKNTSGAEIKGAKLMMSAVSVASQDGLLQSPTGLKKNQLLNANGQSSEILVAEKGTGVGTWNIFLGSITDIRQNIQLTVPANEPEQGGRYTTSLTWELIDGV